MDVHTQKYVKEIAKKLRKESTITEKIVWEHLKDRKLKGIKFRRQHPIGRYIADFYCAEIKLIIEIDGEIHNTKESVEYDKIREEALSSTNINLLRIKNEEILKDIKEVLNKIESCFYNLKKIH